MLSQEGEFAQHRKSVTPSIYFLFKKFMYNNLYIYINYISFLKQDIGNFSLENLDKRFLIQEIIS